MLLTEKYAPKTVEEIIGQDGMKVFQLIKNYKKPILIYGPTGTGKTSTVYAIAKQLNWDVLELSASDYRNRETLEKIKPALLQKSLFGKSKIVLIDDIDALGEGDRGGVQGILELIRVSKFPIVITANDPWDRKIRDIRTQCVLVEYKHIRTSEIKKRLKYIASKENLNIPDEIIDEISKKSKGDLRAAINDLQAIAWSMNKSTGVLSRDLEQTILEALVKIFKMKSFMPLLLALDNVDLEPQEILNWIEYNLFREYERLDDLKRAMMNISRADILIKLLNITQYWRFVVYINFYLSVGVGMSKEKPYKKFVGYKPSDIVLLKWKAKNANALKNLIIERISEKLKVPKENVKNLLNAYVEILLKNPSLLSQLELKLEDVKELKALRS